ncbi:MAG: phosphatidylglycerol lysyltransferase domain-containing protein [Candidatus Cloacimonas sp.]|jgi:uncharacterized membrane protein YbhN (UPF0104 family)|nr:phosphatidylglycerol lysyltransferase domain-containing protein [Candidatus Cloacimonas sp.]
MALKYVGAKIKYSSIAISSIISYSFSNNMGFPLITGAIRYRLYSAWELGAFEITKVLAFCTFTLWFGNPIYRLQGLRKYKEKFKPAWHPMYIASKGGLALPEMLINLISLISTGYKKASS